MNVTLSPSALSLFKDCSLCFWLSKNKVRRPRGIMASIPNGLDNILKDYHDEHRIRDQVPPEVAVQIPGVRPFKDLIKLNRWRTLGKGISATLEGIPVMGLLDDLLMFEDGSAAPYDYKSNKSPRTPEYAEKFYSHQGDLYLAILGENGFKMRPTSYFSFWSPKTLEGSGDAESRVLLFPFDCTIHAIEASRARAVDLVKRAADCLNGEMPGPSEACEQCKYVKVRREAVSRIVEVRKAKESAAA